MVQRTTGGGIFRTHEVPNNKEIVVETVGSDKDRLAEELSDYEPDKIHWECSVPNRFRTEEMEEKENNTLKISPDSWKAKKLLTDSEIAELEKAEENKIAPKDWKESAREEWNVAMAEKIKEKKREMVDKTIENHDWLKEEKHRKSVADLSGSQFVELLEEGLSDGPSAEDELREELMASIEEEPMPEAPKSEELIEAELAAADAWEERGGYWADIAEDIREECEAAKQTNHVLDDSGGARISTVQEGVIEELRALDSESENVEITAEENGVVYAQIDDLTEIEDRL